MTTIVRCVRCRDTYLPQQSHAEQSDKYCSADCEDSAAADPDRHPPN